MLSWVLKDIYSLSLLKIGKLSFLYSVYLFKFYQKLTLRYSSIARLIEVVHNTLIQQLL